MPRGLVPLGSTRGSGVRSVQADLPMARHPKTECLPPLLISERPVVRSFVLFLILYTSSVDEAMLIGSALCKDHLFLYQNENSVYRHQPFYQVQHRLWSEVREPLTNTGCVFL